MKVESLWRFFVKLFSIKFRQNRFIRSRDVSRVPNEGRGDFNRHAKASKKAVSTTIHSKPIAYSLINIMYAYATHNPS
jgi:hypothetical protein